MTQYVDAEALLADVRRKKARTDEIAERARAKLGVRSPRRGGELYFSDGRGPLGWLYEDGEDPELVAADSRSIKNILRIWKRYPRRVSRGTSSIELPSGRAVVYDHAKGEVVRP